MKKNVVIFIDNNALTLQLFEDYFYDLNTKKIFFTSAKKFFIWKNNNKIDYRFIIISDYNMSDINGLELFQKIDFHVDAKVLLSNTTYSKEISNALKNRDIDEFLQKDDTNSFEKLENIINKYLLNSFI